MSESARLQGGAGEASEAAAVPSHEMLVQFLRTPAAQAGSAGVPQRVRTIETHMAWVFLAGRRALKLKKPVRYPSLDYSTAAAREAACREELRLNRRLAPGVYEGVLAVHWRDGRFVLDAAPDPASSAAACDWLVQMRRLPAGHMLDRAIAAGRVTPQEVDALGRVLAAFYCGAARVEIDPREYPEQLRREQAINRELLLRPQFHLAGAAETLDRLDAALGQAASLLEDRARRRLLVDGHGDLRPEHVCLLPTPVVIDALEFNPLLRRVDPFDELAFLALECERAGAAWIGPRLIGLCAAALHDEPPPRLVPLYTAWRALLRARLAMAHLLDPQPLRPQRWEPLAQAYIARAGTALDAFEAL